MKVVPKYIISCMHEFPPTAFCFFLTCAGLTLSTLRGIALCWMLLFELAVFWLRLPCHILEVTAAEAVGRLCHSNPCDCKPWRAMFQETSQQITSNLAMRQLLIALLKNKKAFIYCSFETIFHCCASNVDFPQRSDTQSSRLRRDCGWGWISKRLKRQWSFTLYKPAQLL